MLIKTRNIIVCLGLLIVSSPLFSQQNKDTATIIKHKVLLIPFKSTMLMSEIGKSVNATTHLSYNKIVEAFRNDMDLALYTTFLKNYATLSLLQGTKKADTTLAYIYSSTGYKYDLLPGHDSSGESHAEFDPKLQKTHFIRNGQLQVPMDYSKRFMNINILNPHLLTYLNKKYGTDLFVFINELDIKNVSNPTEDLTENSMRREVIAQYSLLDDQGHYLAKGILTTYFPYNVNDPKVIGEKYFTIIGQSMQKELLKGLQKERHKTAVGARKANKIIQK